MAERRSGFVYWSVLAAAAMLMMATPAAGAPFGKLRGIVVDAKGTPQMGATVQVSAEELRNAVPLQLLTNDRGGFSTEKLLPGSYTVRVTLAGFLPAIEKNIRIDANLTTLLRVELGSVFTSLELLRRTPKQDADPDEWKWVLRASTSSRPVLRYANGEVTASGETTTAESRNRSRAHGRLELTSGARHPGSPSNLADAPSTAFAYEQAIGWNSRLVIAGQASYEREAAASISTLWLPSGEPGRGPQTLMVLRRSSMGPEGRVFRGVRMDHSDQVRIGDNVMVRYGAEYLLVGLGRPAQSFRPRGEVAWLISPEWRASFTVAPRPLATSDLPATPMQTALYAMDSFPALMMRSGRPVMESGWHEEASLEHSLGPNGRVLAAVFRDTGSHTAVFGRGDVESPDVLQDFFSNGFTYDGGATSSRGTRVVYEQRLSGEWEATFIYAFAGALAPEAPTSVNDLRDALETRSRHSLAVRVQGRVPRTGTRVTASYKWISGTTVSRQDGYGEALYQLDPALNITLRQPLPRFLFAGKVEALADFRNLLAQGYVPVNLQEGQVLLIPAVRSVRGGLSFQF